MIAGEEEKDRVSAIRRALADAKKGDSVLIVADVTPKPNHQQFGSDDRRAAREWLYGAAASEGGQSLRRAA